MTPRGTAKVHIRRWIAAHGIKRISTSSDSGDNCYTEEWSEGVQLRWMKDSFLLKVPVRHFGEPGDVIDDSTIEKIFEREMYVKTASKSTILRQNNDVWTVRGTSLKVHFLLRGKSLYLTGPLPPVE
jgi:hypothetical protein